MKIYFLFFLILLSNIALSSDSSHVKMIAKLKELNETGNPLQYYHWNSKRALKYKQQYLKKPSIIVWLKYNIELLNSNNNKGCIKNINDLMSRYGYNNLDIVKQKNIKEIADLLALAYLRLGESENCQLNHNQHSCTIPFKKDAIHTEKEGSQKAIELYSLLDSIYPSYEYKWLLNVAYMTLGLYPDHVPKSKLIKIPNPNENPNFPEFNDIANKLGVDQNGLSGGVCVEDFNNDGLIDIFATSYGMNDQVKLFINSQNGFIDKTEEANLTGIVSGLNCIHADYNNDNFEDIFILRGGWLKEGGSHPNSLLRNNGDGTFTDVTYDVGILSFHPTQTASWADVNRDGFLDLFIGNEHKNCELYINQKNGKFIEQASEYGLGDIFGFTKGVCFGDINNDKWPDLYISFLSQENKLYKNINGKFKDISTSSGTSNIFNSFPCWFWDVNNDGYEDIFVSSYDIENTSRMGGDYVKEILGKQVSSEKSKLFINNGDETFTESSIPYKIDKSMYAMGSNFGDIDNDGWLDFYIGNGAPELNTIIPNRMYRNVDGKYFEEVTSAGRFGNLQKGHGVGFADFDRDGDQDIYVVMGGALEADQFTNILFENPISENNWIILDLIGTHTNNSAIGSKVILTLESGRKIYHTVNTGGSFGSSTLLSEIGVGKNRKIKMIEILWQNGQNQSFNNIESNNFYELIEGGKLKKRSTKKYFIMTYKAKKSLLVVINLLP